MSQACLKERLANPLDFLNPFVLKKIFLAVPAVPMLCMDRPRVQCRPDPEAGPGKQQCSDIFEGGFSGPQAQVDSPYQGFYDAPFEGRVGWSAGGHQRFTRQYMGELQD